MLDLDFSANIRIYEQRIWLLLEINFFFSRPHLVISKFTKAFEMKQASEARGS